MNEQEFIKSIVDAIKSGYDFSRGDLQAYVEAYVTEKYRNLPYVGVLKPEVYSN